MAAAMEFGGVLKKKAIVLWMSDFMSSNYQKHYRSWVKTRCDWNKGIRSPRGRIASCWIIPFVDQETGKQRIITSPRSVRTKYAAL
jgi:hypothetical protein